MTSHAAPAATVPIAARRLFPWLLLAAGLFAVTGFLWYGNAQSLLEFWSGHHGNWRDPYLMERIAYWPRFLVGLGVLSALAGAGVLLAGWREGRAPWPPGRMRVACGVLLAVSLILGAYLSVREWDRYGRPCWDGYCTRAELFSAYVAEPGEATLAPFRDAVHGHYTGVSLLPPVLVGVLVAAGVSAVSGYVVLAILSWIGVAWLVVRIGEEHVGLDTRHRPLVLVLLFGHLSVMRSLVFPQTDPLALLEVLLTAHFSLRLQREFRARDAVALGVTLVAGFFTKLSFLPMFAAPCLGLLLPLEGRRPALGEAARSVALLVGLPFAVCVALLAVLGLFENAVFGVVAVTEDTRNFVADFNPLRLLVVTSQTVQVFPLFLLLRRVPLSAAEKQLFLLALLFPIGLTAIQSSYWLRYFLPCLCLMLPTFTERTARALPGGRPLAVLLAFYVAANALFLSQNLYD